MRKHAWVLIMVALSFWGCASFVSQYFKLGNQAEINKDWDRAIEYYEKAIADKPNEYSYKMSLNRVRMTASLVHLQSARSLARQGEQDAALIE